MGLAATVGRRDKGNNLKPNWEQDYLGMGRIGRKGGGIW